MNSNIMEIWKKYHISPDTSLLYVCKREKDERDARIFLELALQNNHFQKYENISHVIEDIQSLLQK